MTSQITPHPRLSIAIPAYNQSSMLSDTLLNMRELLDTPYCKENPHLFEVLIADNHSSDNTQAVALSFAESLSSFKYFRHDENVGFLANLDFLAHQARGDYIWFLGCGEVLSKPSFLEDICPVLEADKVRNVVIRATWQASADSSRSKFQVSDPQDRDADFFSESISGNVFHLNAYKEAMRVPLVHGSWWPHLERYLHMSRAVSFSKLATYATSDAPMRIGLSNQGWAQDSNSYLVPARELDLLYRTPALNSSLEAKRRKMGLVNLPLWIASQKAVNNFTCTAGDLAEISKILGNAPLGVRLVTLLALLLPAPPLRLARAAFISIRAPKF